MSSTVEYLAKRGLCSPPNDVKSCTMYETIVGSVAYGVADEFSDFDVNGFFIPSAAKLFPHLAGHILGFGKDPKAPKAYQQHHIFDKDALHGKGREYDLNIYSITVYFQLCLENNPNMLDTLYTPRECVLHSTAISEMVRERRDLFPHKKCWPKYKGYAYQQLHKMKGKNPEPGSKRDQIREKYGFDCYVEHETEFLTERGWKRFDNVKDNKLATVNSSGRLEWQMPIANVDKFYTGIVYEIKPSMSRCVVTKDHQILSSPAHRNKPNNFSYKYDPQNSQWGLQPLSQFLESDRSWHHIRRAVEPQNLDFNISDDYLKLAGLFISEGSLSFRGGTVKDGSLSQTENGRKEFYTAADSLGLTRYDYVKESRWRIPKELACRLYNDFGHGSLNKRLPTWCFKLSARQANIFFYHLWLGDGSSTPNGDVYYTCNPGLADDIQACMTASGHLCSIRGPFTGVSTYTNKEIDSYQVYLSKEDRYACIDFKRLDKPPRRGNQGNSIKKYGVTNCRVVCFTVPNGVLITRSHGKVAIQGNCKFAYHTVRLLLEAEMIMNEHEIDIRRHREHLKAIRRGEVTQDEIIKWAADKETHLERAFENSTLRAEPDYAGVKQLLLDCLEHHYGDLSVLSTVRWESQTERAALRDIRSLCDKVLEK